MRALLLHRGRKLILSERRKPEPGPGEVRLTVEACAVGDDDLDSWYAGTGTLPRIPGSEIVGTVDAVGNRRRPFESNIVSFFGEESQRLTPGDRVIVNPFFPTAEEGAVRKAGLDTDGGLQEFFVAPAERCTKVNGHEPLEHILCVPALSEAIGYLEELSVTAGETLIVFGAGGLGAFVAIAAQLKGARVILVDTQEANLEQARAIGIEHTVNPFRSSVPDELEWLAPRGKADALIETSGKTEVMPGLLAVCGEGSRVGFAKPLLHDLSIATLVEGGLRLVGLGTLLPDAKEAIALSQRCDLSAAIGVTLDIERLPASFSTLAKGKAPFLRAMVTLRQGT